MIYGYVRALRDGHTVTAQIDALARAGAVKVFRETASGAKADLVQLSEMLAALEPGDVVVVWELGQLGRSLSELVHRFHGTDQLCRIPKRAPHVVVVGDPQA